MRTLELNPTGHADLSRGAATGATDAGIYLLQWRKLPAHTQRLMRWVEVEGRSYAEVAGDLGLSLPAVRAEVFRVRQSLLAGAVDLRELLSAAAAERS